MLATAFQIIQSEFAQHTDKAGQPYTAHLLRVQRTVAEQGGDEATQCIALLHDLLEDTNYPLVRLKEQFQARVVDGVIAMTKIDGEDYTQYLSKVAQNPDAVRVKLADLKDNMDLTRLNTVTQRDLERVEKYKAAVAFLEKFAIKNA